MKLDNYSELKDSGDITITKNGLTLIIIKKRYCVDTGIQLDNLVQEIDIKMIISERDQVIKEIEGLDNRRSLLVENQNNIQIIIDEFSLE